MKVLLAGYNVDHESLKSKSRCPAALTPETISAAYARISRSPKPVTRLREEARRAVEQARRSNRKIIFDMGHHSIAEHAVFNFDIIGISRLAVEELEAYRLCSYTEKSQRYVTLRGDHVLPKEIKHKRLQALFRKTVRTQNVLYRKLCEKIGRHNITQHRKRPLNKREERNLQNLAKEDARYVLSLATQAQLGATINARNLELMIRRFGSHPLQEVREVGDRLYRIARKITPSIILFCDPGAYDQSVYQDLQKSARHIAASRRHDRSRTGVLLIDWTHRADDRVLAALLFRSSQRNYEQCWHAVKGMSRSEKQRLFKTACQHVELYDSMLREFEFVQLTYALTVSAACFGQLKRHRMATLSWQAYDPSLGVVIPASVKEVGEEREFSDVIRMTEETYQRLSEAYPDVAPYILTNAHQKRVLMNVNMRELYHMSRLREDPSAQWDIRGKTHVMTGLARKKMPIITQLLAGKSEYYRVYKRLFGRNPKIVEVPRP